MKNLLVVIGNIEIPPFILFDKDSFDIIKLPPSPNNFEKDTPFYSSPLLRDIIQLNRSGIIKGDKELDSRVLYEKVIFIYLDYLYLYREHNKVWDLNFENIQVTDNILYTPLYTRYPYFAKDLIFPSPIFWMCSSNTYNILSCISTDVLLRQTLKWNVSVKDGNVSEGIFKNYEIQFWNYLASMNINIKLV